MDGRDDGRESWCSIPAMCVCWSHHHHHHTHSPCCCWEWRGFQSKYPRPQHTYLRALHLLTCFPSNHTPSPAVCHCRNEREAYLSPYDRIDGMGMGKLPFFSLTRGEWCGCVMDARPACTSGPLTRIRCGGGRTRGVWWCGGCVPATAI